MKTKTLFALLFCGMAPGISAASDFDSLCADRAAALSVPKRSYEPWPGEQGEEPTTAK